LSWQLSASYLGERHSGWWCTGQPQPTQVTRHPEALFVIPSDPSWEQWEHLQVTHSCCELPEAVLSGPEGCWKNAAMSVAFNFGWSWGSQSHSTFFLSLHGSCFLNGSHCTLYSRTPRVEHPTHHSCCHHSSVCHAKVSHKQHVLPPTMVSRKPISHPLKCHAQV
jgi:hypothetical protein